MKVVSMVVVCAVALAMAPAARAATITGSVPPEAALQGLGGSITVRAVDPGSSAVVGSARLSAPGDYRLDVPGGLYLVIATASDARGEFFRSATHAFRVPDGETVAAPSQAPAAPAPATPAPAAPAPAPAPKPPAARRRKKCKKPPPRCKRRRYARTRTCRKAKARYRKCVRAQRRKPAARAATLRRAPRAASGGRPAIGVVEFSVPVEGHGQVALWQMAITSVGQTCIDEDYDHVAAAASDLAVLEAEIAFQQSEYVDPSTRVDPSRRIHATHHISGEGGFDAQGNGTLTLHVRTAGGAHVTSVTVSGSVFDATDAAAQKLAELLCKSSVQVAFAGERRNRWQRYDCANSGFNNYDGTFTYHTPPEKRFRWPLTAGDVQLPGHLSYQAESGAGSSSDSHETSDWLNWEPAGEAMSFWLEGLSFNPGGRVGFTTTRDALVEGPVTFPVNVTWNQTAPFHECTDHYEGYVTGSFTVSLAAKVDL